MNQSIFSIEHDKQPGEDVLAGKWLHPTTGAVEDSNSGSSTQVTKDSIKYTYFIRQQRFDFSFFSKQFYFCLSERL